MVVSLETRNSVVDLFLDIIRPLKSFYSPGHAFLHAGNTGVHYGEKSARMEGFARVLWGLAPLWSADNTALPAETQEEIAGWLSLYKDGIIHGTDPEDEEYWGDMSDYDQKMVEAPAIAFAVLLNRQSLWDDLTEKEKSNLYGWLSQMNDYDMPKSNWRCFRIMTNMALRLLGLSWSQEKLEEDFEILENSYIGDGWYYDGNPGQIDYYVPCAIHWYNVVYSKFMEELEPERCLALKARSTEFFHDFVYWFANDGTEIPFGRSLTYRYAHCAPFAAMAYAELDLDYGVLKNLVLRNLESWVKRPIFDNAGILSIGYGYPNLTMSENYNGCGSPYWGNKAFLILGLNEDHPFWKAEPKSYPFEERKFLKHPHMLITHDKYNHVLAYVTGQHSLGDHGQAPAKYEKFVYSNQFGFSVSRGTSLEEGAFDNTLAVAYEENRYYMRYGMKEFDADDTKLFMKYQPMHGVTIESTVVPCSPWHVRIHKICNDITINVADGGFALPRERCFTVEPGRESGCFRQEDVIRNGKELMAAFPWGTSCIVSENGGDGTELIVPFSNTNLFYNLTVIPTVRGQLTPGTHLLVTSVAADFNRNREELLAQKPDVEIGEHEVTVSWKDHNVRIEV